MTAAFHTKAKFLYSDQFTQARTYSIVYSYCYPVYMSFSLSSLAQVGLLGAYTAGTYVDSMWGVAQFSLSNESPCMCAFVGDKKSVVGECCPLENKWYCVILSPVLLSPASGVYGWYISQIHFHSRGKLLHDSAFEAPCPAYCLLAAISLLKYIEVYCTDDNMPSPR